MDQRDMRIDAQEMKRMAEKKEEPDEVSPKKNGIEKQVLDRDESANVKQQQHSSSLSEKNSKQKVISQNDESEEKNHNSSDNISAKHERKDSIDEKEDPSSDDEDDYDDDDDDDDEDDDSGKNSSASKLDNDGDSAKESDYAEKSENDGDSAKESDYAEKFENDADSAKESDSAEKSENDGDSAKESDSAEKSENDGESAKESDSAEKSENDGNSAKESDSAEKAQNGGEKAKESDSAEKAQNDGDKAKESVSAEKAENNADSAKESDSAKKAENDGNSAKESDSAKKAENDGNSAKESNSAEKAENGLENKTKKTEESKSTGQNVKPIQSLVFHKPENAPQQQSSLLLAKLANQQVLKKNLPSIAAAGSKTSMPVFSLLRTSTNSSNFSKSPFVPKLYYSQNLSITDEVTKPPKSSIQQIEAIRKETLLHSMSTKAQRILKAKAKAELVKKVDEKLGPLATFLNNLGLDIVKQSVYHEAIHIQSRKQQAGKLTDVECSQLDKMRSSCKELAEKLRHLKLGYRKCKLCNFVSESVNVHFWHREHPHINQREDFCCSYCAFNTRNNPSFNFHMEAEHNIKGRSMDKPSFWQCTLCPFEHNSKSKLTQHKFKCERSFELKTHLSPSPDTDINYSLYGVFYLSEKEEALKAIALHKAKQAQLKAQQAQYKVQQQQAATNRANYFNANKISPIQPKPLMQSNMGQRIPVVVHPKVGSSLQPKMPGSQMQANRFQLQTPMRHGGQSNIPIKPFTSSLTQNSNRIQLMMNQSMNKGNLNLLKSQLPVKDLINIHQAIKGQSVMTAKSLASQKLIPSNNQSSSDVSEFEICELCGGYVKDRDALRIHFFYAHRVEMPALMFEKPCPPLFCDVCDKKFWTSQGLQKHRVSLKHYAKGSLSQVCILCGCLVSHLLNHMTDTHQLNLQDFLNQKRCIVCGNVCLSRSETEIHMAASHGILVKRTNANSSDTKVKSDEKPSSGTPITMVTKGGQATTSSPASQLVKGNYCVFCKVPFASNAELTQHCLLVHKACKKCGMVLPGEGSLGSHKCQISIPTVKACSVCKQEILIQEFIKHVEEKHLKKCSIKLRRLNSEDIKSGISDTKARLDLPVKKQPNNTSGSAEKLRKRKAEDVDLAIKKRKLVMDDGSKNEAISISDSEDDDDDDEGNQNYSEKKVKTESANLNQKKKNLADGLDKVGKDIKMAESGIRKQGRALSPKQDSESGSTSDTKKRKDSKE